MAPSIFDRVDGYRFRLATRRGVCGVLDMSPAAKPDRYPRRAFVEFHRPDGTVERHEWESCRARDGRLVFSGDGHSVSFKEVPRG